MLVDASDMLLAGGATILPNLFEGDIIPPGTDDLGAADEALLDYDVETGNHYGHSHRLQHSPSHGHSHSHVHDPGHSHVHGGHAHYKIYHDEPQPAGAAAAAGGGASWSGSALNLRSGSPGQHSSVAMARPFADSAAGSILGARSISSISFEYQFVIGYGSKPNSTGGNRQYLSR